MPGNVGGIFGYGSKSKTGSEGKCGSKSKIGSEGKLITHHLLVIKVINKKRNLVIHKTDENVVEEERECSPRHVTVLDYDSQYTGEQAIRRARDMMGEEYSLSMGNCEHFVTEARTGEKQSYQVTGAIVAGVAGGTVGAGAGVTAGIVGGALVGASTGSIVPVAGTTMGGVVGAIIVGVVGLFTGAAAGGTAGAAGGVKIMNS